MTGPEFHPGAVYRINIDTDGDDHADIAFTFTFSGYQNGTQAGTAWYATGAAARHPEPAGETLARDFPVSFDATAHPADDVTNYLSPWTAILQNAGGYTPDEARAAALQVLPDILRYDHTKPATYPNGRTLTDDVYSHRFTWLTNGKVPPTGLKPHTDLLTEFPYLGPPNP